MLNPAPAAGFLWFRGSRTDRRLHQWPGISELAPRRSSSGCGGFVPRVRLASMIETRGHIASRRHLQPGKELSNTVFSLLHTPPRANGFNRTTWRLPDLLSALQAWGVLTTPNNLTLVTHDQTEVSHHEIRSARRLSCAPARSPSRISASLTACAAVKQRKRVCHSSLQTEPFSSVGYPTS
jgi:hypothetical protein